LLAVVHRLDNAEKTMPFIVSTGCEIEVGRCAGYSSGRAEGQAPQTVNGERTFPGALEQALEMAAPIEGHDGAATEVAAEQLVGMRAKGAGRYRQSPGRIHLADISSGRFAGREAMKFPIGKGKDIN